MTPWPVLLVGQKNGDEQLILKTPVRSMNANREALMALVACQSCGLLYNSQFDIRDILYENAKASTFFNHGAWTEGLEHLKNMCLHKILDDELEWVVELGFGDCNFSSSLLEELPNRDLKFIGFDPDVSRVPAKLMDDNRYWFCKTETEFKEKVASKKCLVIARHVFEHLEDIAKAMGGIEPAPGSVLLVEVPDGESAILKGCFEDLVHEHVSYFGMATLNRLLSYLDLTQSYSFSLLGGENIGSFSYWRASQNQFDPRSTLSKYIGQNFSTHKSDLDLLKRSIVDNSHLQFAFWGVGGRCAAIVASLVEHDCPTNLWLVDSDPSKFGLEITKDCIVRDPASIIMDVDVVVIGSRPGLSSIRKDLNDLNYMGKAFFWKDLPNELQL